MLDGLTMNRFKNQKVLNFSFQALTEYCPLCSCFLRFPDGQEGVDFWASFPRLILSVIETFKEGKCENPYVTYDLAGRLFDSVIWPAVVLKLVEEKWEF